MQFCFGDHFINSHNLFSWSCTDVIRRKLTFVTVDICSYPDEMLNAMGSAKLEIMDERDDDKVTESSPHQTATNVQRKVQKVHKWAFVSWALISPLLQIREEVKNNSYRTLKKMVDKMFQSFYLKFQVRIKNLRTEKSGHCREVDSFKQELFFT